LVGVIHLVDAAGRRYNAFGWAGTAGTGKESSMSLARRSPRGFSLTEIMMAVGILGVGMTMVATIFPVAVDQTRRANDSTMAALCARSTAALIRAARADFVKKHRLYFKGLLETTDANRERPAEFGVPDTPDTRYPNPGLKASTADGVISKDMRVYNPNLFLYEAGRRYATQIPTITDPFWPQWNAGNYVPVIYVTPIVPQSQRSNADTKPTRYNSISGPWRITIVVFKSRGFSLASLHTQGDALHPRAKGWADARNVGTTAVLGEPTFAAGAGDYIIDRNSHAGEAYLIDMANTDPGKTVYGMIGNIAAPPIFLACSLSADGVGYSTRVPTATGSTNKWYVLPGAVGAFHTIIGD
jgi:prepilin-type N-terminal cleavage/methylation domain-containing protein